MKRLSFEVTSGCESRLCDFLRIGPWCIVESAWAHFLIYKMGREYLLRSVVVGSKEQIISRLARFLACCSDCYWPLPPLVVIITLLLLRIYSKGWLLYQVCVGFGEESSPALLELSV